MEQEKLNQEEIDKFKRMAASQNVKPTIDPTVRTPREMEFADKYVKSVDPGLNASLTCLLYTSPSPRDATLSRMPSSA